MNSKTLNIIRSGELIYFTFPKLEKTGMVRHCFTTRFGGVSKGCLSSMNMNFNRGDERENVIKNYEKICGAIGIDTANLVFTKQTHTDNCVIVTEKDRGKGFSKEGFSDVDGLVTDRKGVALVTQFADCTPLIFCDPVKGVIASVHSGWRGTVKRIGKRAVEIMANDFGCAVGDIIAAIGPCIGKCCYEVDDAVFDAFSVAGFDTDPIFTAKGNGHYMLDLTLANKHVIVSAGINPENIDVSDVCTCCNSDELFSHRASGGKRGTMAAIIELK
ncbi:MAG: peptidoglycan editing factor PgeF [Clostridia bacterium]|nr:peptidoglycan editing factor PgeF [Clostridia bacterium]